MLCLLFVVFVFFCWIFLVCWLWVGWSFERCNQVSDWLRVRVRCPGFGFELSRRRLLPVVSAVLVDICICICIFVFCFYLFFPGKFILPAGGPCWTTLEVQPPPMSDNEGSGSADPAPQSHSSDPGTGRHGLARIEVPGGYETDGDLDGFVTCDEGAAQLLYAAAHPEAFNNDTDSATDYDDFESPDSISGKQFFVGDAAAASSATSSVGEVSTAESTPTASAANSLPPSPAEKVSSTIFHRNEGRQSSGPNNADPAPSTTKFHLLSSPRPLKSLPKILEGASSGDEVENSPGGTSGSAFASPARDSGPELSSTLQAAKSSWQKYFDDDGNAYWYNEETQESSWYRPPSAGRDLPKVVEERGVQQPIRKEPRPRTKQSSPNQTLASKEKNPGALQQPSQARQVESAVKKMGNASPTGAATAKAPQDSGSSLVLLRDPNGDLWERHTDLQQKAVFYFNQRTESSQWHEPAGLMPVTPGKLTQTAGAAKSRATTKPVASPPRRPAKSAPQSQRKPSAKSERTQKQTGISAAGPDRGPVDLPPKTSIAANMRLETESSRAAAPTTPGASVTVAVNTAGANSPTVLPTPPHGAGDYLSATQSVLEQMAVLRSGLAAHEAFVASFAEKLKQSDEEGQLKQRAQQQAEAEIRELSIAHQKEIASLQARHASQLQKAVVAAQEEARREAREEVAAVRLEAQIAAQKLSRQVEFERAEVARIDAQLRSSLDEIASLDVRLSAAQQEVVNVNRAAANDRAAARQAQEVVSQLQSQVDDHKEAEAHLRQLVAALQAERSRRPGVEPLHKKTPPTMRPPPPSSPKPVSPHDQRHPSPMPRPPPPQKAGVPSRRPPPQQKSGVSPERPIKVASASKEESLPGQMQSNDDVPAKARGSVTTPKTPPKHGPSEATATRSSSPEPKPSETYPRITTGETARASPETSHSPQSSSVADEDAPKSVERAADTPTDRGGAPCLASSPDAEASENKSPFGVGDDQSQLDVASNDGDGKASAIDHPFPFEEKQTTPVRAGPGCVGEPHMADEGSSINIVEVTVDVDVDAVSIGSKSFPSTPNKTSVQSRVHVPQNSPARHSPRGPPPTSAQREERISQPGNSDP